MRRSNILGLTAIAAILLPTGAALRADDPAPSDEPGRVVLFDGQSLDGWSKTDFYGSGEVTVEDGAIVLKDGEALSGMTGITTTRDDLPRLDYELTYTARRLDGRDFFAAATFPVGESFVTLVNGGWGGAITGISSINGADASENETSCYIEYKNDTWYRFRIQVTGRKIVCQVDDKVVVDFVHEGSNLGTRLETRANEPLGFATWDSSGAIREISLRKLTPEEVHALDRDEP